MKESSVTCAVHIVHTTNTETNKTTDVDWGGQENHDLKKKNLLHVYSCWNKVRDRDTGSFILGIVWHLYFSHGVVFIGR